RVHLVLTVLEPHQLVAYQAAEDGRGVGGGADRPEQEVNRYRGDRGREDGQRLHHLLRRGVQQLVGLPDQYLDHHVLGQVARADEQVTGGEAGVALQDGLDCFQRPREPAGVLTQGVKQLIWGIAEPEAAIVI